MRWSTSLLPPSCKSPACLKAGLDENPNPRHRLLELAHSLLETLPLCSSATTIESLTSAIIFGSLVRTTYLSSRLGWELDPFNTALSYLVLVLFSRCALASLSFEPLPPLSQSNGCLSAFLGLLETQPSVLSGEPGVLLSRGPQARNTVFAKEPAYDLRPTTTVCYMRRCQKPHYEVRLRVATGSGPLPEFSTMPTPSSDQPPSPPMPPSHVFPTCPDDLQTSATHECDEGADTESNSRHGLRVENRAQSPALIGSAQTIHGGDNSNSSPRTRDTILAQEGRASLGPSSRATTMSPRPQSVATAGTSPLPDAVCDEVNKIAHCDDDIAPSRATADPSRPGAGSSGRRSPDQTRNLAVQAADAASALSEDELYGPSMGSHFPSARVSRYNFSKR